MMRSTTIAPNATKKPNRMTTTGRVTRLSKLPREGVKDGIPSPIWLLVDTCNSAETSLAYRMKAAIVQPKSQSSEPVFASTHGLENHLVRIHPHGDQAMH